MVCVYGAAQHPKDFIVALARGPLASVPGTIRFCTLYPSAAGCSMTRIPTVNLPNRQSKTFLHPWCIDNSHEPRCNKPVSTRLTSSCTMSIQNIGSAEAVSWPALQYWMGRNSDTGSQRRNLEFVQGAGDNSPTLHKCHSGIFNVHQLMQADETSS